MGAVPALLSIVHNIWHTQLIYHIPLSVGAAFLMMRDGKLPFAYLDKLNIPPFTLLQRRANKHSELFMPEKDCPYVKILTATELSLVQHLLHPNPSQRGSPQYMLENHPYFLDGPGQKV